MQRFNPVDSKRASWREPAARRSVRAAMCGALLVAVLVAVSAVARAEAPVRSTLDQSWTFSFYFENDLFANTDQNYTNGVKLSWVSSEVSRYADMLPAWTETYIDRLPFIHRTGPEHHRNVAISLGQSIYTPQDIESADVVLDERPYAGWLYLGVAFQNRTPSSMDDLEVQLGVVGPASFAEQAQLLVHEVRGIAKPRGWSHQLDNEPGIALVYHRLWRKAGPRLWGGFSADAIGYLGGALGNVYIYGDGGAELRFGWNLPGDFGSAIIRPGSDTSAPIAGRSPRRRALGFQVFLAGELRAVAHNIFLDGNTIADSHSVEKRHLVADFSAGVSVVYRQFKLSAARVIRTREFEGQERLHRFGSITLSYSY